MPSRVTKFASDYGKQRRHWDGFDMESKVRLQKVTFEGGLSLGKTLSDNCEIVAKLPEVLGSNPKEFCHNVTGWQPNFGGVARYELPWQDLRFSGNFHSVTGPGLQAGVLYANTPEIVAALGGRNLTAGANKTVNVFDPNTLFGDRLYQMDLRFTKVLKVAEKGSIDVNFDIYNTLNSDAATAETTGYSGVNGGAWRKPTGVIQGRLFKFGMRWDF